MTLNDLQDVVFVDADRETVQAELIGLYTSVTGRTLAQGDPVRLFLLTIAEIIIQQREYINYTGKQNLLKYAAGNNLDHLGILVGVERLPASSAVTTVLFALSEKRAVSTVIPAGTRVTAGDNVFFAIGSDAVIPAGTLQLDVSAACTQTGEIGNGYLPGELSTLVDPVLCGIRSEYNNLGRRERDRRRRKLPGSHQRSAGKIPHNGAGRCL